VIATAHAFEIERARRELDENGGYEGLSVLVVLSKGRR
jgi:hypothetical protein